MNKTHVRRFDCLRKIATSLLAFAASTVFAQTQPADDADPLENEEAKQAVAAAAESKPQLSGKEYFFSSFQNVYPDEPDRPRSGWLPVLSFILPGLDQFAQGQYGAGATYAGYAIAGLSLAQEMNGKTTTPGQADISSRDNVKRQVLLGDQMYELGGAMSAYQSYHSIINVYRQRGVAYDFIKHDETTLDLLTAPFDLRLLKNTTTWAPLVFLLGGIALSPKSASAANYIDGSDIGYLGGFSLQAGIAEESIFRGAFLPSLRQWWGSNFWSNSAQATVFAAVHISSDNPLPLPQFMLGWYLGWLTQRNNYSLRESIFIHAWWDIIAFSVTYLDQSSYDRATNLFLPLVDATF